MAQITYLNKVALNVNPNIDDILKSLIINSSFK